MTDLLTNEERQTVERARFKIREDEAFDNPHTLESELLAIIDNLSQRCHKRLSGAEVEKLWEKLRYAGSNNPYLYFHELDRNQLFDGGAVRKYLGALEEE